MTATSDPKVPDPKVIVGRLSGSFGVRGEVRLKSFCADPEAIADYTPLITDTGLTFTQVVLTGQIKGGFTARLDGVVTKEDADALTNVDLYALRSALPQPEDDEFYYADLEGLTVLDTGGVTLGRVVRVVDHGAGDLLDIAVPGQSETVLLPFTRALVPTVDLTSGRIIADPPDGLFPAS